MQKKKVEWAGAGLLSLPKKGGRKERRVRQERKKEKQINLPRWKNGRAGKR